jgi:hypothetical protein
MSDANLDWLLHGEKILFFLRVPREARIIEPADGDHQDAVRIPHFFRQGIHTTTLQRLRRRGDLNSGSYVLVPESIR